MSGRTSASPTVMTAREGVPLVVDANIVISALIADAATRQCLVLLDEDFVTPELIHDEIDRHRELIVEKSDLSADRIDRFLDILFTHYVSVVPMRRIVDDIDRANEAIGVVDPDDVLYLATALAVDGAIWSDDRHFEEQDLVPVVTTPAMVERLDTAETAG